MADLTRDPEVRCPVCLHEWQESDSFEMGEGSEVECEECGTRLECTEVDLTRYWRWRPASPMRSKS